jgi:hypothetical protein
MKKPKKIVVNLGVARCGTTATATLFSQGLSGFSTPRGVKELKYFLGDHSDPGNYFDHFDFSEDDILFESSPPYMGRGLEKFERVLDQITELRDLGIQVTVLVHVKNLMKRAFSHYWHGISSHHAIYGSAWRVREADDPRRFDSVYTQDFSKVLANPEKKFMPRLGKMLSLAIERLGEENVCILHTPSMDAGLDDFLNRLDYAHDGVKTPRIPGARSPLYLLGGQSYSLKNGNSSKEIEVPEGRCLLFARRYKECLDTSQYDMDRIIGASNKWSRSFEKSSLKPAVTKKVKTYLSKQGEQMSRLPEGCFLGGCRDALLEDMVKFPDRMDIKPLEPSAVEAEKLLES